MDCEHFDTVLVGALYDEQDEVTRAAMKRHREGCARCESTWSELSSVRELAVLPLEEPSDELEGRILAAVGATQRNASWPRRLVRTLAWAGSHAMRPQLAAAAVLLLILGSSVLLLRPKPGSVGALPVHVTEHGVPAPEQAQPESDRLSQGHAAKQAAPGAPRPPSAAPVSAYGASRGDDRARAEAPAGSGGRSGCSAAFAALDEAMRASPMTEAAADTMWEAAECYRAQGQTAQARALYAALRETPRYGARAAERVQAPKDPSEPEGVAAARAAAPAAAKPSKKSRSAEEGTSAKPAPAE